MTESAGQTALDQDTRRAANRKIVERYMNNRGQDRLSRHLLFAEDGAGGLWTTDTGCPIVIRGRARLAEHAARSLRWFPDWAWTNVQIFETQDPDWFWVECDGEGKIIYPGYPDGYYRNHFLHSFRFRDGKILQQREFMNPCEQFRALGIAVPRVRRKRDPHVRTAPPGRRRCPGPAQPDVTGRARR